MIPDGFGTPCERRLMEHWLYIMEIELHFVLKIMQQILVIAKSFISCAIPAEVCLACLEGMIYTRN
jgi:hypothetical protein